MGLNEDSWDDPSMMDDPFDYTEYFDLIQGREDELSPRDNYWLSDEQASGLIRPDGSVWAPKASDWERVEWESVGIEIAVDKSRRQLWDQAKREISWLEENVKNLQLQRGQTVTSDPVDRIFRACLGPESRLARRFLDELDITKSDYCQFMETFLLSCAYKTPVSSLFDRSRINSVGLMPVDQYNQIWRAISECGAADEYREPFWQLVQQEFNNFALQLFMPKGKANESYESVQFKVGLDDDKVHYAFSKDTNHCTLKPHRHTKDNRNGYVQHIAATAATCLPLASVWHREGQNNDNCYIDALQSAFGRRSRPQLNLSGLTLSSDRGYWGAGLVSFVLKHGGDLEGTSQRLKWFPFTFDKKKTKSNENDLAQPENIESGYKMAHYKSVDWKIGPSQQRQMTACAYTNGVGNSVALLLSSTNHTPVWDMVTASPKDHRWYFDPEISKRDLFLHAFVLIAGEYNNTDLRLIASSVEPRTTSDLGADWFLDRSFSLTSSTVDKIIRARAAQIECSHKCRKDYTIVLQYVGLQSLLPPREEEIPNDESKQDDIHQCTDSTALQDAAAPDDSSDVNSGAKDDTSLVGGTRSAIEEANSAIEEANINVHEASSDIEDASDIDEASREQGDAGSSKRLVSKKRSIQEEANASVWVEVFKDPDEVEEFIQSGEHNKASDGVVLLICKKLHVPVDEQASNASHNRRNLRERLQRFVDKESERPYLFLSLSVLERKCVQRGIELPSNNRNRFSKLVSALSRTTPLSDEEEGEQTDSETSEPPLPSIADNEELSGQLDQQKIEQQLQSLLDRVKPRNANEEELADSDETSFLAQDFEDEAMVQFLSQVGLAKIPKSTAALRKKATQFVLAPVAERPFIFMTAAQLKEEARNRGLLCTGNVQELRTRLAEHSEAPECGEGFEQRPVQEEEVNRPMLEMLKASCLRPQKNRDASLAAKMGRENEEPFLRQLWKLSEDNKLGGLRLKALLSPGMVLSRERKYLKDSSDGLAIYELDDGTNDVLPIEIKSRVSVSTSQKLKALIVREFGLAAYDPSMPYFLYIGSDDISLLVPSDHEQFQLLHHAYCYGVLRGLMVIGDQRNIKVVILVDFDEDLYDGYGSVLDDLYQSTLSWAYKRDLAENLPEDSLQQLLQTKAMKKLKLTYDALLLHLHLWRALNIGGLNDHIRFPLPPMKRIIPLQNSVWNDHKGPTDTLTKLIDNVEEQLGVRSPNSIASARGVMMFAAVIHRAKQMFSAKDVDQYDSLAHYRNANNKRWKMSDSVEWLSERFQRERQAIKATNTRSVSFAPSQRPTKQARGPRARSSILPANFMEPLKMGVTPKKGTKNSKSSDSKAKSDKLLTHELRASNCDGLVFGVHVDATGATVRRACTLCGTTTPHFCTGCQRFLCLNQSRAEKLVNLANGDDSTGHKNRYLFTRQTIDGGGEVNAYMLRTCYHVAHESCFQQFWDKKHQDGFEHYDQSHRST